MHRTLEVSNCWAFGGFCPSLFGHVRIATVLSILRLTLFARRRSAAGGATLVVACSPSAGSLYFIGQLAEPITYQVIRHPRAEPERLASVTMNIVLPALLTFTALRLRAK